MDKNKIKTYVKENYVWLLTLFVLALTFVGLCGSVVTAKVVNVAEVDGWYEVTKVSGRAGVAIGQIFSEGTYVPFLACYLLVLVAVAFTVLGRKNKNFYVASTLVLLCTAIFFLTANTFYDLAYCIHVVGEANLFEELHAVSDAKLGFGSTFAAILCFSGALLNVSLSNEKSAFTTRDMSEIGVLSALAIGLQFIKIPIGATGGSINLGLLPLFMIALRHGPAKGFVASALIFGLITCLTDGYGFNTYPFDYLIGFGGTAVLGFGKKWCFADDEKGYSLFGFAVIAIGIILASVIRFIGSSASSMINYGYSLVPAMNYNVIYVFVTGAVNLVAMEVLFIPMAKINKLFPVK